MPMDNVYDGTAGAAFRFLTSVENQRQNELFDPTYTRPGGIQGCIWQLRC